MTRAWDTCTCFVSVETKTRSRSRARITPAPSPAPPRSSCSSSSSPSSSPSSYRLLRRRRPHGGGVHGQAEREKARLVTQLRVRETPEPGGGDRGRERREALRHPPVGTANELVPQVARQPEVRAHAQHGRLEVGHGHRRLEVRVVSPVQTDQRLVQAVEHPARGRPQRSNALLGMESMTRCKPYLCAAPNERAGVRHHTVIAFATESCRTLDAAKSHSALRRSPRCAASYAIPPPIVIACSNPSFHRNAGRWT